jgi:hypothetical protein
MSEILSSSQRCSTCGKDKTRLHCGICEVSICKVCSDSLDSNIENGRFLLMTDVPKELLHPVYCHCCFVEKVNPPYQRYLEVLERAKNIIVFDKGQKKETRLMRRNQKPLRVESCADRQETLMRLAFGAAEAGFNGLLDVDLSPKKIREGSYQTTSWSGSGIPAQIEERRVLRDRSLWDNPN